MRNPADVSLVETLLADPDSTVRIAAVEICAALQSPQFVPQLLQLYKSIEIRAYVLSALEKMPETSIPAISEAAGDPNLDEPARDMLLQVLASIGGKTAQKVLWEFFSGNFPLIIRIAAGNALRRMALANQLQAVQEAEFEARLEFLCEEIRLLMQACQEIGDRDEFVWQLLHDHTRLEIENFFQLLAFKYNVHQIEKIRYNFFSPNPIHRSNALELLDDLLPRRIAADIGQLLVAFVKAKATTGRGLSESTAYQLMTKEPWLKVISIYHLNGGVLEPGIQVDTGLTENDSELYLLLDKLFFLKKAPLFKNVPGNYLVSVAKIAQAIQLKGGEILFQQGDQGDAMYLVCSGSISVQINGVEVAQMEVGDALGEMAILDRAPRSASCIAKKDTELLRIADQDFETLVKSQTSVALAVFRTLAERLRRQTANPLKQAGIGEESMQTERKSGVRATDHLSTGISDLGAHAGELNLKNENALYNLLKKSAFLKKIPLFEAVPENYLISLAKIARSVSLQGGEILFQQGEQGDAMYLICRGSISVQVNGIEVNRMHEGDCLGEMALLDGTPRSASCIAREDSELLRISGSDFETVVRSQTSVVLAMLRTLARRLRQQTLSTIILEAEKGKGV